ncbi:MAG TPA: hypothetical protein VE134_05270, partial [Methanomicrobiales archaeon]|nr:hypothetical protein [Methanomicrobiales archaeon]
MGYLDDQIASIEKKKTRRRGFTLLVIALLAVAGIVGGAFILSYTQERSVVVIPLEGEILTGDFFTSGYIGSEYVG